MSETIGNHLAVYDCLPPEIQILKLDKILRKVCIIISSCSFLQKACAVQFDKH
jgi:hypothetical protein